MQRLRAILAEMRAAEEAEEQRLAAQVNRIVPEASGLALQAASDPNVTRFNALTWFRARLPDWLGEATLTTVSLALVVLFGIYTEWLTIPESRPHTWIEWVYSQRNNLRDYWQVGRQQPSFPDYYPMSTPCAEGNSSIVDEVFAKHEAKKMSPLKK
mgnify:FL=1